MTIATEPRPPRPRGEVEAEIATTLVRHGALSLRSLSVNVPGRRINEADVQDALDALQQRGLVEDLPGGLFRLNTDAAARFVAAAAQEELRAYRSRGAVEQPPVFR